MLPQGGGRAAQSVVLAVEPGREAGIGNRADHDMVHPLLVAPGDELGVVDRLSAGDHRSGGHAGRQQFGYCGVAVPFGHPTADGGVDLIVVGMSLITAGPPRPVLASDQSRQRGPLGVVVHRDHHPAILTGRCVDTLGGGVGRAVALALEELAVGGPLDHLLGSRVQPGLDQRNFHQQALAGLGPMLQRQESGEHRVHPAQLVAHPPGHQRTTVGVTGEKGQAAGLLDGHGEAGAVAPRPIKAESRHPHHDGVGIQPVDLIPVQTEILHHPGGVVLDDDVGHLHQPFHLGQPVVARQIQRDRPLAGVGPVGHRAPLPQLVAPEPAGEAHPVGPLDGLHLDDVGAQSREQTRCHRPSPECGQVAHFETCQRQRGFRSRRA